LGVKSPAHLHLLRGAGLGGRALTRYRRKQLVVTASRGRVLLVQLGLQR
jgi:hypothetical protein